MTRFTKAHACGNDFLIVEGAADSALAARLCARNTGVGADGVEFFEWIGDRAGRIHLVNADGSFAEISGNGTRCVAAWMAHEKRLGPGDVVRIETDAGPRECRLVRADGPSFEFAQGMGVPVVHSTARGDQHVTVKVVTPTNLSPEEKRLFEELDRLEKERSEQNDKNIFRNIFEKTRDVFQ